MYRLSNTVHSVMFYQKFQKYCTIFQILDFFEFTGFFEVFKI